MRVLLINDSYEGSGAEVSLRGTLSLLKGHSHDIFFFGFGDSFPENALVLPHSPSSFLRSFERFFFSFRVYSSLLSYIKQIKPDIIHLHNNTQYSVSVLFALLISSVPVVHTVHDWTLLCSTSWGVYKHCLAPCSLVKGIGLKCYTHDHCLSLRHFLLAFFRNKMRFYLERKVVSSYLPPSIALRDDLKRYGFSPVETLHHFVEFEKPLSSKKREDIILYVGTLSENKGLEYLIKAVPSLLKELPHLQVRIIGSGPDRERLERLSEGLPIIFTGRIPHTEVMKEYLRAKVFVLPSIWMENSPFVLYECLIAGLPVVASRRGGIPDLVKDGETGFLVDAADSSALADRVLLLFRDKKLHSSFSKNSHSFLEKNFSTQKYVDFLLSTYSSVLQSTGK